MKIIRLHIIKHIIAHMKKYLLHSARYSTVLYAVNPGYIIEDNFASCVTNTASSTMAVAAIIASGVLQRETRRNVIVSRFISGITGIITTSDNNRKISASSFADIFQNDNNSISVISLINKSESGNNALTSKYPPYFLRKPKSVLVSNTTLSGGFPFITPSPYHFHRIACEGRTVREHTTKPLKRFFALRLPACCFFRCLLFQFLYRGKRRIHGQNPRGIIDCLKSYRDFGLSRRHVTRHLNCKPMAVRYLHRLFKNHKEYIA